MPIYEFYCADCHAVFNFLSRRIDTDRRPPCPRCRRPRLERKVSSFAIGSGEKAEGGATAGPEIDDARMEAAMRSMAHEMEGVDESDPRQMARMMRKLYDSTGLRLGEGLDEAIRRLEAGEDPDSIEEELGGVIEQEDPLEPGPGALSGLRRRLRPPARDDTLYEL